MTSEAQAKAPLSRPVALVLANMGTRLFGEASEGAEAETRANEPRWDQAVRMLQDDPQLVTPRLLLMALQHRPPAELVRLMLEHSPHLATVPLEAEATEKGRAWVGPPLHVALASGCDAGVVRLLAEASPSALTVRAKFPPTRKEIDTCDDDGEDEDDEGELLDPLAYAQMYRPNDAELISLLRSSRATGLTAAVPAVAFSSASVSTSSLEESTSHAKDKGDADSVVASASALTRLASNHRNERPAGRTQANGSARASRGGAEQEATGRTPTLPSTVLSTASSSSSALSLLNLCVNGTTTLLHGGAWSSPDTMPYPPKRSPDDRTSSATSSGNNALSQHQASRSRYSYQGDAISRRPSDLRHPPPIQPPQTIPPRPVLSQPNEEELVNVKRLCAAVVRGHRKLSKRMDDLTRSVVESTVASEERVMHVLLSELAHRDDATSAALSGWHESVSRQLQESVRKGVKDVLAATMKREEELLRRLADVEQLVQEYETFRSFEIDPPATSLRHRKATEWMVPVATSDASRRTAVTAPMNTADKDGSSSFDDSWAWEAASSSFCHFDVVNVEDVFDNKPGFLSWTFDDVDVFDGDVDWMGRQCIYGCGVHDNDDDDDDDVARSLLCGADTRGWSFARHDFQAKPNRPTDRRPHQRHCLHVRRHQRQGRRVLVRIHQSRPLDSCLLWLPPLHRWVDAVKMGKCKCR